MDLDSKLNHMTTLVVTETPQGIAQGSGFFYSVSDRPDPDGPQYQWVRMDLWLITNRHVVMPKVRGGRRTHPQSRFTCEGGTHLGDQGGLPLSFPATISRNGLDSTRTSVWMWPRLMCRNCWGKK